MLFRRREPTALEAAQRKWLGKSDTRMVKAYHRRGVRGGWRMMADTGLTNGQYRCHFTFGIPRAPRIISIFMPVGPTDVQAAWQEVALLGAWVADLKPAQAQMVAQATHKLALSHRLIMEPGRLTTRELLGGYRATVLDDVKF